MQSFVLILRENQVAVDSAVMGMRSVSKSSINLFLSAKQAGVAKVTHLLVQDPHFHTSIPPVFF